MSQADDMQSLIGKLLSAPPEEALDTPNHQSYYAYDGQRWRPATRHGPASDATPAPVGRFRLITWNIDILSPGGPPRMKAALSHVKELVSQSTEPVVIFFQEMSASDLEQISNAEWVQDGFYMTDFDTQYWKSPRFGPPYGTTTLIDRSFVIDASPFRVLVPSRFARDALFVDLRVSASSGEVLRLCNVHLESLVADPPVRPHQVSRAAAYVKAREVSAGVIAGDMNAIEPFDRLLHIENGLKDAFLELGGREDSEEGFTWGQQAPKALREQFGCSRMDKAFYHGNVRVLSLQRIGEGVEAVESAREEIRKAGGETWASDHLGLSIVFELSSSSSKM